MPVPPTAVEKATPRAQTLQIKAQTPPRTSSTQAHLLHQSVKAQAVDLQKAEQKVTILSRMTPARAVIRPVQVEGVEEEQVELRETDHSQRFTSLVPLESTPIVTR